MHYPLTSANLDAFWICLTLAVATSSIVVTVTNTEVFAPWRAWTEKRLPHMLSYLFKCFYCLSHWVIFLGIFIYRPVLIQSDYLIADLIVSAFVTITLSTLVSGFIAKASLTFMNMKMREKEVKEAMAKQ
jgi:hypothetical protein